MSKNLAEMAPLAGRFKEMADGLKSRIKRIETRLQEVDVRTSVWSEKILLKDLDDSSVATRMLLTEYFGDLDVESYRIGYAPNGSRWRLLVRWEYSPRKGSTWDPYQVPLVSAPCGVQMLMAPYLDEFVRFWSGTVKSALREIETSTEYVESLCKELTGVDMGV